MEPTLTSSCPVASAQPAECKELPEAFRRQLDALRRVETAPMVGGLVTSFILELLVYPAVYYLWKGRMIPDESATLESGLANT